MGKIALLNRGAFYSYDIHCSKIRKSQAFSPRRSSSYYVYLSSLSISAPPKTCNHYEYPTQPLKASYLPLGLADGFVAGFARQPQFAVYCLRQGAFASVNAHPFQVSLKDTPVTGSILTISRQIVKIICDNSRLKSRLLRNRPVKYCTWQKRKTRKRFK